MYFIKIIRRAFSSLFFNDLIFTSIIFTNYNLCNKLTGQTAITLKHPFHIGLAALKCIQVPDKNAWIHRLWVLRIGLVAHFAHLHRLKTKRKENSNTSSFVILNNIEIKNVKRTIIIIKSIEKYYSKDHSCF